jgi:hypothetical protein
MFEPKPFVLCTSNFVLSSVCTSNFVLRTFKHGID